MKQLIIDIKEDYKLLVGKTSTNPILALFNRGLHSLILYRIGRLFLSLKLGFFSLICARISQIFYGIDIDPKAQIQGGIIIYHGNGIVIGKGVSIGRGTKIYHQVTLGIKGSGKQDGFPKIGADCILGAGAIILGPIKIGDRTIIGANTVVSQDVEMDSIVLPQEINVRKRKSR